MPFNYFSTNNCLLLTQTLQRQLLLVIAQQWRSFSAYITLAASPFFLLSLFVRRENQKHLSLIPTFFRFLIKQMWLPVAAILLIITDSAAAEARVCVCVFIASIHLLLAQWAEEVVADPRVGLITPITAARMERWVQNVARSLVIYLF